MSKAKKVALWGGLAFLVLMGIACGVGNAGNNTTPATHAAGTAGSSAPGESPVGDNMYAFGETVSIDGIVVSLTPVPDYAPSEWSAGYSGGAVTCYLMKVENQTEAPINPWSLYITASAPGGQPVESIYDTEQGVTIPSGELFPGEVSEWKIAFDGEVERVKIDGFLDGTSPAYFTNAG